MAIKNSTKSNGFKSLADQLADLEDPTPKDFDPEDPNDGFSNSEDEFVSEDDDAGREHYEKVGKSKLRKPETISLGKEYAGSRVSRNALEDDGDEENPFQRNPSDEDDDDLDEEDEDDEDDDDENLSGSEEDEEGIDFDEDGQSGFSDDDDISDDLSTSDQDDAEATRDSLSDERAKLRRLMATDQKTIAATISQAAKADTTKGFAVKRQRLAFDALLNARIKLQKGFPTITDPAAISWDAEEDNTDAITSAESAALALWSTLEELRLTLADVQSKEDVKKRKRPPPASDAMSSESLWQRMQDLESQSQIHRRAVLEKWNHKVRRTNASILSNRNKLIQNPEKNSIIAVLEAQVAAELSDRATKKQRTSTTSAESAYDDTPFYQTLLRDLVEQRMSSSDAVTNGLDSLHLQIPTHPTSGMRKDKVHKDVDTKASKGRKIRYNVHEKLQNFMAPEDRGTWSNRTRDEFFASLLGKSASGLLREADGEDEMEGIRGASSDEEDMVENGLKLFRS